MTIRRSAGLAWSLLAGYIVLWIGLPVLLMELVFNPGVSPAIFSELWILSGALLPFVCVGALIAAHRPDNRIGWLMLLVGFLWLEAGITTTYVNEPDAVRGTPLAGWISWVGTWDFWPPIMLVLAVMPLIFPTGHLPSPRWCLVLWAALAALMTSIIYFGLSDEAVNAPNAPGTLRHLALGDLRSVALVVAWVLWPLAFGGAALSVIVRFRRATGIERQQLKWFAYVGAVVANAFWVSGIQEISREEPWQTIANIAFYSAGLGVLFGIPSVIAIAILRYRLYDIDRIINRTIVYGLLSLILIGTYFSIVLGLGAVLRDLTGRSSQVVVAASTLAVAALFQPLRMRIQMIVDRRFNRTRYDAARTIEAFSSRLRDEIDLPALCDELRAVIDETMRPSHTSVWIRSLDSLRSNE